MNRRGLLAGILAAGVAPAFVGSKILMPVKRIITLDPPYPWKIWFDQDWSRHASPLPDHAWKVAESYNEGDRVIIEASNEGWNTIFVHSSLFEDLIVQ